MKKSKKKNGVCVKGKPPGICHTNKCSTFNNYDRHGLPCTYFLPDDRGYEGQFWERKGRVIRRQYFNIYITICLCGFIGVFVAIGVKSIVDGTTSEFFAVGNILMWIGIWVTILLPFFALSLLNHYFFGRRVCLINKDGLFCSQCFLSWEEIQSMVFHCGYYGKNIIHSYAHVAIANDKELLAVIPHAPYHLLRWAKKYHPEIRTKFAL